MGKLKHPKKHISQNRSVKNNKTNQPKIKTKWQESERERGPMMGNIEEIDRIIIFLWVENGMNRREMCRLSNGRMWNYGWDEEQKNGEERLDKVQQ